MKKQYNDEIEKLAALINAARDYNTACMIRNYVHAIEQSPKSSSIGAEWIEWAYNKADWLDPAKSAEDTYATARDAGKGARTAGSVRISQ